MPAATSSKSSTSASSAPPRCARPRSSSWWRRATASTPARWCARSRKRASGFRFLEAPGLELLIGHAELRLLRLIETAAEAGLLGTHHPVGTHLVMALAIRGATHGDALAGAAGVGIGVLAAGFPHRALDDPDLRLLQPLDDLVQRHGGDEAQIERSRHGDMRPGLELPAPLVQIDLLLAEAEREPLLGRRLEARELHAEHLGIEADARRLVARR